MDNQITAIIIPSAIVLAEVYKLVARRLPVGLKAKQWLNALIPLFVLGITVLFSVLYFGYTPDVLLASIISGFASVGLYSGVKNSAQKTKSILKKPVQSEPLQPVI